MEVLLHNEQELLARVSGGDENAFATLVGFYTTPIYKQLLLYIKNAETAEELAQDVFLSIWKNREKLKDMQNFAGYVYVAARNKINMAFREKLFATEQPPEDLLQNLVTSPEKSIELKELSSILHKAIGLLPPRRLQVFTLSRMDGKSYEEIASQLSITRSAVKQHIIEALLFLRTHLKERHGIIVSLTYLVQVLG